MTDKRLRRFLWIGKNHCTIKTADCKSGTTRTDKINKTESDPRPRKSPVPPVVRACSSNKPIVENTLYSVVALAKSCPNSTSIPTTPTRSREYDGRAQPSTTKTHTIEPEKTKRGFTADRITSLSDSPR